MQTQRLLFIVILLSLFFSAHAEISNTADKFELKFVTIPAGQFTMGTTDLSAAIADLPESQTPVTQRLWLDVMGTKPGPKFHWAYDDWQRRPVVDVTWYDAGRFIDKLNQNSSDKRYRLPTEAEWEYAARAGSTGLRPFSRLAMDEYAWFIHNSNDEVQAVAQLESNAWGLYDMYGNIWEWVSDWYSPTTYTEATRINPQGPEKGIKKVRRGGSFHCPPHLIRSAYRATNTPNKSYSVMGFRLVSEEKQPSVKP